MIQPKEGNMKHILFIFLLLFTVNAFAKSDLWELIKNPSYDLTYGVTLPEQPPLTDFSKPYVSTSTINVANIEHASLIDESFSYWYHFDFVEDPFDGRIEIMVMGEPSASTTATLLISCILGLTLYIRKRNASIAQ